MESCACLKSTFGQTKTWKPVEEAKVTIMLILLLTFDTPVF